MSPDRVKASTIALVGRSSVVRAQLANYLRASGFEVCECEVLGQSQRVDGAVVIDDELPATAHDRVAAWVRGGSLRRVVIASSKPAGWRELAAAEAGRVWVVAAPAFGWQIVDALRATTLDELS